MAKYTVDGFIRVSVVVEADSEDEAFEMAMEAFDIDKHVPIDADPEWDCVNEVDPLGEEEDDEAPLRTSTVRFNEEDDDDN